jgi:predicted RecB family nuclease
MGTKSHTVYKVGDIRVPSVTGVLGILDKPALLDLVARVTRDGEDWRKVRDTAGNIGTLAHAMILAHIKRETMDLRDYSPVQIDLAENAVLSYLEWEKQHNMEPILVEKPLVSEQHMVGGTPDLFCKLDDVYTIVDFKTGKSIYKEHSYQICAYGILVEENDPALVTGYRILRIGKDANDAWDEVVLGEEDVQRNTKIFLKTLELYKLLKEDK